MSDQRLRELERKAQGGDPDAAEKLARERARSAHGPVMWAPARNSHPMSYRIHAWEPTVFSHEDLPDGGIRFPGGGALCGTLVKRFGWDYDDFRSLAWWKRKWRAQFFDHTPLMDYGLYRGRPCTLCENALRLGRLALRKSQVNNKRREHA